MILGKRLLYLCNRMPNKISAFDAQFKFNLRNKSDINKKPYALYRNTFFFLTWIQTLNVSDFVLSIFSVKRIKYGNNHRWCFSKQFFTSFYVPNGSNIENLCLNLYLFSS